jgi:hypothetical protein
LNGVVTSLRIKVSKVSMGMAANAGQQGQELLVNVG